MSPGRAVTVAGTNECKPSGMSTCILLAVAIATDESKKMADIDNADSAVRMEGVPPFVSCPFDSDSALIANQMAEP